MSPTVLVPGVAAVKSRPIRSGFGNAAAGSVVRRHGRGWQAFNCRSAISSATSRAETRSPEWPNTTTIRRVP
jgi:hypothetical protein